MKIHLFFFSSGKSTHNQRIERLWQDVYGGCLFLFYQLFQYLEVNHLLDADNDVHIWCLHYIYLLMINSHLQTWKNAWIHHPLSTEKNKTPMQLWIGGLHFTQFGQRMLQEPVLHRCVVKENLWCRLSDYDFNTNYLYFFPYCSYISGLIAIPHLMFLVDCHMIVMNSICDNLITDTRNIIDTGVQHGCKALPF